MKVTLKDGREIKIDLYALTVEDIRKLGAEKGTGDEILAKALDGLKKGELSKLPYPDYRRLTKAFWECVKDPLKDDDNAKNSQSESTSD